MPCTLGMMMLSSSAGAWLTITIGATMVMFFAAAALITIGERLALWPTTAGTCRNCEYDLRGRGSDACPECGEPI
jgi:hypothetical protein